jgi:hypothetical protein
VKISRALVQSVLDQMDPEKTKTVEIVDGYIPYRAFDPQEAIRMEVSPQILEFVTLLAFRLAEQNSEAFARQVAQRGRMDFREETLGLYLYFEGVVMS